MPVFQPQVRTLQSWLAGIGASGSLVASSLIMFIVLVGVTSFDSWPGPGAFRFDAGSIKLNSSSAVTQAPAPGVPNLARLLGGPAPLARTAGRRVGERRVGPRPGNVGGGRVLPPAPAQPQPPSQTVQPPAPSGGPGPSASPRNVVQQTVSATGNTVEGATTIVGDNLGGSHEPGLGGVVGGVGRSVNGVIQGLAGS